MRIEIRENSRRRLHVVLRVRVAAYLLAAVLFIGMGLWSIWMLAFPGAPSEAQHMPAAGLLLGAVCIGGGFLVLAVLQRVTLYADRERRTLRVTRRCLLWPAVRRHELHLDDLRAIHVLSHTLHTGRHELTSYGVRLQTAEQTADQAVSLSFLPMFTRPSAMALAAVVRIWLQPRRIPVLHQARGWPLR